MHRADDALDPVSSVLQAERDALADVERFTRQTLLFVLAGCLRAVLVQRRAEARVARVRERMTADAQLRRARIRSQMEALEADSGRNIPVPAVLDAAIARLAAELAGITEPG